MSFNVPGAAEVTEDGAKKFSIGLAEYALQFEANTNIAAQIVFKQCGLAKLVPVVNALSGMVAGVTHTINQFIDEFDADD